MLEVEPMRFNWELLVRERLPKTLRIEVITKVELGLRVKEPGTSTVPDHDWPRGEH